jgi:hypothetical protein
MIYYYDPDEIRDNTPMLLDLLEKTEDCAIIDRIKEYFTFGRQITRKDLGELPI